MTSLQLTKRVEQLERDIQEMKLQLQSQAADRNGQKTDSTETQGTVKTSSWREMSGIFANDPLFEKAMRYGRAYRRSLRPKARKPQSKKS